MVTATLTWVVRPRGSRGGAIHVGIAHAVGICGYAPKQFPDHFSNFTREVSLTDIIDRDVQVCQQCLRKVRKLHPDEPLPIR